MLSVLREFEAAYLAAQRETHALTGDDERDRRELGGQVLELLGVSGSSDASSGSRFSVGSLPPVALQGAEEGRGPAVVLWLDDEGAIRPVVDQRIDPPPTLSWWEPEVGEVISGPVGLITAGDDDRYEAPDGLPGGAGVLLEEAETPLLPAEGVRDIVEDDHVFVEAEPDIDLGTFGGTGCTISWEEPVPVMEDVEYAFNLAFQNVPYAAIDEDGNTYLVYGYAGTLYIKRLRAGVSWWTTHEVATLDRPVPGVAIDPTTGNAVVIARDGSRWRVYEYEFTDVSALRTRARRVSTAVVSASGHRPKEGYASVAVDDDGAVHVAYDATATVFVGGVPVTIDMQQSFHTQRPPGSSSWTEPVSLSLTWSSGPLGFEPSEVGDALFSSVAVQDGVALVAWRLNALAVEGATDVEPMGVRYRMNFDVEGDPRGGWDPTQEIGTPIEGSTQPGHLPVDPSAWTTPGGNFLVGYHTKGFSKEAGPWVKRLDADTSASFPDVPADLWGRPSTRTRNTRAPTG